MFWQYCLSSISEQHELPPIAQSCQRHHRQGAQGAGDVLLQGRVSKFQFAPSITKPFPRILGSSGHPILHLHRSGQSRHWLDVRDARRHGGSVNMRDQC
jgi:hypothetical protein